MNKQNSHPKGLYLLFVTEMWERFSYYGMRAIFILYMTKALLIDDRSATSIYGSYTGLVYLTPLLGGYIADRYWGNRRSILAGGVLMAIGQFFMFFSALFFEQRDLAQWLMFMGLAVLILGNGFFKPNISTMVGDLYEPTDSRKDSAFTIFYMGINLGAFVAPLWCGTFGDTDNPADFKWGFLSAAIGMVLGILVFQLLQNKYLCTPDGKQIGLAPSKNTVRSQQEERPNIPLSPTRLLLSIAGAIALFFAFSINYSSFSNPAITLFQDADWIGSLIYAVCVVMPVFIATDKSLTKPERSRIYVIYLIAFFVIFFWAAFEQAGSSLTLLADRNIDRHILGWEMPASYFQSVNAGFVVLLAPVFVGLWTFLGKKKMEPISLRKQAFGLFLLAIGYWVLALGFSGVEGSTKVSMYWLIGLYLFHTMGELCLSPIGLSIVNKLSPVRFASLLMGVWFMSTAAANKVAGVFAGYLPTDKDGNTVTKNCMGYEVANLHDFFMLFVIMSAVAGVIMLFCIPKMVKMMHGVK